MSSHNEQVQPTPFDVAQPAPPQPGTAPPGAGQGAGPWVLPALGALLLLALLVVFWLPDQLSTTATGPQTTIEEHSGTNQVPSGPPATTATPKPDASPWSEAQLARLRKDAQDVLSQLLDVQSTLEEHGVQQWAAQGFTAATARAAAGDELYKTRQYEEATAQYTLGLEAMQALQDSMPGELASQLGLARQGIEDGDAAAVDDALERAGVIEPDSPELAILQQRAAAMPQLLALLEQAAAAEQGRDLAAAEQFLEQAAAVDPLHLRAQSELQRVAAAHREQRFNDAMSAGYSALDEGRFDTARKAFRAAAQLHSGSSEAASALQEVEAAATAHRLATLKQRGNKLEQQEQWQDAVASYEQAQQLDSNVLFASAGLQRSRARARLDKQFRTALEEPQRLSDAAVAEATGLLLQQAQKITPRGPVLEQQISRLQLLLQQANTPVAVTLRSDLETEVIVYKVARLGRFEQRELTLRPGTYTAVGTRNGYRDVRRSFTINHDSAPAAVTIACTEPI